MAIVEYTIPLCPYERRLLQNLKESIVAHDTELLVNADQHIPDVFKDWIWSNFIQNTLQDVFGQRLGKEYHGDLAMAHDGFMNDVRSRNQSRIRAELIRKANPGFLKDLADHHIGRFRVIPEAEDTEAWILLSHMCRTGGRRWARPTVSGTKPKFEIYQLVRTFLLETQWPKNHNVVLDILSGNPLFTSLYDIKIINDDEQEDRSNGPASTSVGESVPTMEIKQRGIKRPDYHPKLVEDVEITDEYIGHLLRVAFHNPPLEADPRSYLLAIPWTELTEVAFSSLDLPDLLTDVKMEIANSVQNWLLWEPARTTYSRLHHLYTEETLYSSSVLNNWTFPNFLYKGKVLFALSPIESTKFFHTIQNYWADWNDCAVTLRGNEAQLCLLETVPGLLFRFRERRQGRDVALSYFRNIAEARGMHESSNKAALQSVLGQDYSSIFEYSLQIIPSSHFAHVNWTAPIGRGDNGAVFEGTWHRSLPQFVDEDEEGTDLKVVLKEVRPRGDSRDAWQKFMKELNTTHAALAGSASGCTSFLGITTFPSQSNKNANPSVLRSLGSPSSDHQHSVYLVFERATQGTLLPFLVQRIRDSSFCRGWEIIVDALTNVALGLRSLHKREVVHRDLHLNNILVSDEFFPHEPPPFNHQFQYLISDVGESKMLNALHHTEQRAALRASYGAIEFRAPEVSQNVGWTKMADVFAFGVIVCKILSCRQMECSSPPPSWYLHQASLQKADSRTTDEDSQLRVPAALMEVTENCLAYDPQRRPSMQEVATELDQLLTIFGSDRDAEESGEETRAVEWTVWDWEHCLARSRMPEKHVAVNDIDEEPPEDD